jgi:N-acetylmuramoyl-L-alanine amidase-like protein/zinc carboxypeptidase
MPLPARGTATLRPPMNRTGVLIAGLVACVCLPVGIWGVETAAPEPATGARQSIEVGSSVRGRRIAAVGVHGPGAGVRVLVVGSIHGAETAGHAVIRRLRALGAPAGVEVWTVRTVNPDGVASGTRQNAHGVDLNRNFPDAWRLQGRPFSPFYSGRRPLSEPESRAARRLVRTLRPDVTIWYHQALRLVDLASGADPKVVRGYARRVGLPAGRIGFLPGVATRWQNHRFPGTSSFVVELGAGRLSEREVDRHASAVLRAGESAGGNRARLPAVSAKPPEIQRRRIPFGRVRKEQMRHYARRHYGIDDHRLLDPRVIVLHLSVSDSAESVFQTFAHNVPDPELGELPGLCAHYVVDPRGRILELVSRRLMCRHTVGLNHVSFGIEHVGRRHSDVMGRRSQLRASLRLVRWLQERYGIRTRNVIGHNESLKSPYHFERVARLRRQTHGDFPSPVARRYRKLLAR